MRYWKRIMPALLSLVGVLVAGGAHWKVP